MNRKILWGVLAIGLVLVIAPLAMGMPGKAAAGQRMLTGFQPIMEPAQVATTAHYYNDVFVPLGTVTPMMSAANVAKFQGYMQGFGGVAKLLPPAAMAQLAPMERDFTLLLGTMQKNTSIFSQVPAGLAHYKPLVTTMQANVDNYAQVNSLPNFRLFAWFFIVPGALLVLLAGFGLVGEGSRRLVFHHRGHPTAA